MAVLDLFPARVAFVDLQTGRLTNEAYRALNAVFARIGGASAPNNNELAVSDDDDGGLEEFKHETSKAIQSLSLLPPVVIEPYTDPLHPIQQAHAEVQHLMTELAELREQMAVLVTRINDIEQGSTHGRHS